MQLRVTTACVVALALLVAQSLVHSERLASSEVDQNGDPVDLFADPFAVDTMNSQESHESAVQRSAETDASTDRFMMAQVQSELEAATKLGTKASFNGVRNFVSQLLSRIQTEQKIADDDAKAEVLACRGAVETQRARTLAQMQKVKRINASLVHESELVRELPLKIAALSTRVSTQRKSSLVVKSRLARLNKDRKVEREEMKAKRKSASVTLKSIQRFLENVRRLPIKLKRGRKTKKPRRLPRIPNPIDLMRSNNPPVASSNGSTPSGAAEQQRAQNLRAAAAQAVPGSTNLPGDVAVQVSKTSFRSSRPDAGPKDPMADIEQELDDAQSELNHNNMEDDDAAAGSDDVESRFMSGEHQLIQRIAEKGSLAAASEDEEQDAAWLSLLELWADQVASNATSGNATTNSTEDLDGPAVNVDLSNLKPLDADLDDPANPAAEAILNGLDLANPDGDDPNRNPNVDTPDAAANATNVTANATVPANGTASANTTRVAPPVARNNQPIELTAQSLKTVKHIFKRFARLKAFFTKYMLQLDEQEKQQLKTYFQKKRLLLKSYYLHFTEYRKAGRRRHWTILRLKRARVLSKQRAASMQFNLPLFLLLKQQLTTLKKGCNDTENTLQGQSTHRAQTLDTITAILKVIDDRINGVVTPTSTGLNPDATPTLPPVSLNAGSRNFSTCRELVVAGFTKNGVYTLTDADSGRVFLALCNMKLAGGGWMLAFKQSNFASGTVRHDEKLYGAGPLLHTKFNSSSMGSLLAYGKPKQLLFVASDTKNNWFTTSSLNPAYQYWDIEPTPRYCFYRPMHDSGEFQLSPTWTGLDIWPDTDIQLMDKEHPDISAVTVGQMMVAQKGPQCMQPHCNPNRHGRFQGQCQNGSKGEGNWMIFSR